MRDRKRQHSRERDYSHDQPWREERRDRYPDEPYGGERGREFEGDRQSHRDRGAESMSRSTADDRRGADYRGDFGPDGLEYYRHEQRTGRAWDTYAREGDAARGDVRRDNRGWSGHECSGFEAAADPWNTGGTFGFGPEEDIEGRGSYGYGPSYGHDDMNRDRAGRGDWRDSDWVPNRPARGRGTWAGDWADARSNIGMAGYRGRGPKDYRRSDDRIREEVCDLFTDDPALDASEVSVRVENADVTLTGTVTTRAQKRRIEDLGGACQRRERRDQPAARPPR